MYFLASNTKGVSLPIVVGLVSAFVLGILGIHSLVINQLRFTQRIESSNQAYFMAEAALEDALYELSARKAGYETPNLNNSESRKFNSGLLNYEWSIQSRKGEAELSGKLLFGDRFTLNLFTDNHQISSKKVGAINDSFFQKSKINTLRVFSDLRIYFSIPENLIANVPLQIDNDQDFSLNSTNGLNEDLPGESNVGFCANNPLDDDCDGQIDEDHPENIVISWKLTDGKNRFLIPKKGCLSDGVGSEICEKDFRPNEYKVALDHSKMGIDQSNNEVSIGEFIRRTIDGFSSADPKQNVISDPNAEVKMNFVVTSPLEHIDLVNQKKIKIPHIIYSVESRAVDGAKIPNPFFTIYSDGYSGGLKQSLSTQVKPEEGNSLSDFTLIQVR